MREELVEQLALHIQQSQSLLQAAASVRSGREELVSVCGGCVAMFVSASVFVRSSLEAVEACQYRVLFLAINLPVFDVNRIL